MKNTNSLQTYYNCQMLRLFSTYVSKDSTNTHITVSVKYGLADWCSDKWLSSELFYDNMMIALRSLGYHKVATVKFQDVSTNRFYKQFNVI